MKSPGIACIVSVALFVAALAAYGGLRVVVANASATVAGLSQQIDEKNAELARVAAARDALTTFSDEETTVEGYFVQETAVVPFIDELQSRGSALGSTVEITSVTTVPAEKGARPTLLINLSITGSFDAIARTLGSLEYAPYAIAVTSATFAQGAAPGANGTAPAGAWTARVSLSVGSTAAPASP